MVILIFTVLFCALGGVVFFTLRAFRRVRAGISWWIVYCALLLAGIATGCWAGFSLEYAASPTLRLCGFPFPAAVFRLESGVWVDYVPGRFSMILIGVADVMAAALCAVIPVLAAWGVSRFLQRRRRAVRV